MIIVTWYSEFDPKNVESIKQGLIKTISKPLRVNQLPDLAKKHNQIRVEK